jgi:hypothetical protein
MLVKYPPASTRWSCSSSVSTVPPALCRKSCTTRPAVLVTRTRLRTAAPCTLVNDPPRYTSEQYRPPTATEFTTPLTLGFQLVTVNG